jgi:hypothetical protein
MSDPEKHSGPTLPGPIFPDAVNALDGLSLSEAFRTFILNDLEVVDLSRALSKEGGESIRAGYCPGIFLSHHWPLDLSATEIASRFVQLAIWFPGATIREPSPAQSAIAVPLADRLMSFRQLLSSGALAARGTFASSGAVVAIDPMQWKRAGISIDAANGDLCEDENNEQVPRWTGISLQSRKQEKRSPNGAGKRVQTPSVAADFEQLATPEKVRKPRVSAEAASIGEAVRALWLEGGPPPGLHVARIERSSDRWRPCVRSCPLESLLVRIRRTQPSACSLTSYSM